MPDHASGRGTLWVEMAPPDVKATPLFPAGAVMNWCVYAPVPWMIGRYCASAMRV